MARATRIAATAVGAIPLVLVGDAVARWATGWRPLGPGERALAMGPTLGLLLPLLAMVPRLAAGRVLPRLLAIQGALTFALLAIEVVLRVAAPLPAGPLPNLPRLRIETRAEANLHGFRGTKVLSTNGRGYRGRDEDPADEVRIVAIGGSTTECFYLDDGETWPELLRGEIERLTGRRTWVGNAGRAGLGTWDHVQHLRHLPEVGRADVVLVLCGINDMFRHLGGTWETARAEAEARAVVQVVRDGNVPLAVALQTGARLRGLARSLRSRADGDRHAAQDAVGRWVLERRALRARFPLRDDLPDMGPACEAYAGMLRRLVATARERGTRPVLMTQPTLYGPTVDPLTEPWLYGSVLQKRGFAWSTPALHRAISALNDTMVRVAAETGTPCICLDLRCPREERLLYDDCHFNEAGARRVAEVAAPVVADLLRGRAGAGNDGAGPGSGASGAGGRGDGR